MRNNLHRYFYWIWCLMSAVPALAQEEGNAPLVFLANASNSDQSCQGDTVTFIASGQGDLWFEFFVDGISQGPPSENNRLRTNSIGVGVHQVEVEGTDIDGNIGVSDILEVEVLPRAEIEILHPIQNTFTDARDTVHLVADPPGGVFSGVGVLGETFNPSFVGTGLSPYTIAYTYTADNGCVSEVSFDFSVLDNAEAITGLETAYCQNTGKDTILNTESPDAGLMILTNLENLTAPGAGSIVEVVGEEGMGYALNPSQLEAGAYSIEATYADANGNQTTRIQEIQIIAPPTVSFEGLEENYCLSSESNEFLLPVELTGFPAWGTFSGPGVSDSGIGEATFDLGQAGEGTHQIQYEVVNDEGCANSVTQSVKIHPEPQLELTGLDPEYCYNADTVELSANFSGGNITGDGITSLGNGKAKFLPSAAIEEYLFIEEPSEFDPIEVFVEYSYTDENGCKAFIERFATVNPLPEIDIESDIQDDGGFCYADTLNNLYGTNFGAEGLFGSFTGPGVSDQGEDVAVFNIHEALEELNANPFAGNTLVPVSYTFTDERGCTNTEFDSLLIYQRTQVSITGLNDSSAYCLNDDDIILSASKEVNGFDTFVEFFFTDGREEGVALFPEFEDAYTLNLQGALSSLESENKEGTTEHPIGMTYYDSLNCPNTVFDTIRIHPLPEVMLEGLADFGDYCYDTAAIGLRGFPGGGSFIGDGLTSIGQDSVAYRTAEDARAKGIDQPVFGGTDLSSAVAYEYTSELGCTNRREIEVYILSLPQVEIRDLDTYYCVEEVDELRANPSPSGGAGFGFFTGALVEQDENERWFLNPESLEENGLLMDSTFSEITYEYMDERGCSNTITDTALILPRPTASFVVNGDASVRSFCYGDPTISLQIIPEITENTAGEFSGSGVNDVDKEDGQATFSPSLAYDDYVRNLEEDTVAQIPVSYSYTDSLGCNTSQLVDTLLVYPLPIINIKGYNSEQSYCFADSAFELEGMPRGGQFSGAGIESQSDGRAQYSPKTAYRVLGLDSLGDNGTDRIVYTFTNTRGCTDSLEVSFNLRPIPPINNFSDKVACYGDTLRLEPRPNAVANGGSYQFFGPGVIDLGDGNARIATADLARANGIASATDSVAQQQILYAYTNSSGCTNTDTAIVTVNPYTAVNLAYENAGIDSTLVYCDRDPSFRLNSNTEENLESLAIQGSGVTTDEDANYNFSPTVARQNAVSGNPELSRRQTLHPITLSYTNIYGCTSVDRDTLRINPLPRVNFGISTNCIEEPIFFIDSTGTEGVDLEVWAWSFGNGKLDSVQNPTHQFETSGIYDVRLTVTTAEGCSDQALKSVTIGDKPTALFSLSKVCAGDTTVLDGSGSLAGNSQLDEIAVWDWSLNDSGGNTLAVNRDSLAHIFSSVADYEVSLRIETNNGCADTLTQRLSILPSLDASELNEGNAYLENFEQGNGGWSARGINSSWEWGIPTDTNGIAQAATGERAWVTNLDGAYNAEENSVVNGPCLDFSNLDRPMISLKLWSDTDSTRDGTVLQYSLDDGGSWLNIGELGSPYNWYDAGIRSQPGNNSVGQPAWTGRYRGWKTARHRLDHLSGEKRVRLRVAFASDLLPDNTGGFGFDEVWIGNRFKRVLVERFTNSSNPADLQANDALNRLIDDLGSDDIVAIQYHTASPSGQEADPLNEQNPFDPSARKLFYGLSKTPASVIDGEAVVGFTEADITARVLGDSELLGILPFSLEISFEEEPSNALNISTVVQANELVDEAVTLHVAVIERVITGVNGANGETEFEWTLRKLLPDAAGRGFSRVWNPGDTEVSQTSWQLQNVYDPSQVQVVAFIQQDTPNSAGVRQVYQTAYAIPPSVPDVITGVEGLPEAFQKVVVYPNPSSNKVFVGLKSAVEKPVSWSLGNLLGQKLKAGELRRGSKGLELDVSGLPTGIYLLRGVQDGSIVISEKLIVE